MDAECENDVMASGSVRKEIVAHARTRTQKGYFGINIIFLTKTLKETLLLSTKHNARPRLITTPIRETHSFWVFFTFFGSTRK